MRLQVDRVNWSVEGRPILRDVSLSVEQGSITGLIGPNGSGKSTLLRCIYRALRPDSGTISLDGDDLRGLDSRETARRIAVVLQEYPSDFQFTVGEIVSMGRNPHKGMFDRDTTSDRTIIRQALARVGLAGFFPSQLQHSLGWGKAEGRDCPDTDAAGQIPRAGRTHQPPGYSLPAGDHGAGQGAGPDHPGGAPRPEHRRHLLRFHTRD